MANVGELLENPELLEAEAERFAEMCMEKKKAEPWDQGPGVISTPEQFCAILDRVGRQPPEAYAHFCEAGKDDF